MQLKKQSCNLWVGKVQCTA
uniref:Uncharacterized protein n=1 Tax=Rhizophora mucronata TaxID=61149 RepID=A0A2P2J0Y1_RHIMU